MLLCNYVKMEGACIHKIQDTCCMLHAAYGFGCLPGNLATWQHICTFHYLTKRSWHGGAIKMLPSSLLLTSIESWLP